MRLIVRFDVDTWSCAHRGMPFLVDLARTLDARFSFMVNMGRAVSRTMTLSKGLRRRFGDAQPMAICAAKLGSVGRMGLPAYLHTAIINPQVGSSAHAILHRALKDGHSLGLHGGRNHGEWQWGAQFWDRQRLQAEVAWGVAAFEKAGLPRPTSFSSPGWNSPPLLPDVLLEQGFAQLHDRHVPGELNPPSYGQEDGLVELNTAFAGEPGGIGFFENAWVRDSSAERLADEVASCLQIEPDSIGMVYDHPVFCAGKGQVLFSKTIERLRELGVELIASCEGGGK
ncbi:hypothetical protein [Lysobacter enzymogenes]|uniref:hypothetical protein n=1 Tax=Lysobacter enzymogenes TaxID=69 RepID=UPI0019CFC5D2|nr:hypothetical protein [Lysobacter enzymogenes]